MIRERHGNLLEAEVDAVVNTVNTVGVMGKGIALQFKQAFPENYRAYRAAYERGEIRIGEMFVFDTHRLDHPRYVINFPTKRHWRHKARISDIELGLTALVRVVRELGISSIAVPALGCGNGGLEWTEVRPLIVTALQQVPEVEVSLFPPAGAPSPGQMPVGTERPEMTRGRAAIISLINGYVAQARAERVEAWDGASLLEIQKLMYLLQAFGQPMRLAYSKGKYGPYAENLNHQLQRIEGHYVRGYGDRSRRVLDLEPIVLLPGAVEEADAWLRTHGADLPASISAVLGLIDGFASPYGLELLCTVHWVAQHESGSSDSADSLVAAVQSWSRRKAAIFTNVHVRAAMRRLAERRVLVAPA